MVVGPRFSAFWPVGIKAYLEYEWLFLAEAYSYSYDQVMAMPCGRRNKAVKFREEVVRQRNANSGHSGATVGASAPSTWYQRQQAAQKSG